MDGDVDDTFTQKLQVRPIRKVRIGKWLEFPKQADRQTCRQADRVIIAGWQCREFGCRICSNHVSSIRQCFDYFRIR